MKKTLKKTRSKKFMCAVMAVAVVIQCMAALTLTVSAATTMPTYKQTEAFTSANGAQGKDGWYYMYKDYSNDGAYKELTWDAAGSKFGDNDKNVNANYIMPGFSNPTAIVWEAQHTGDVTLKATNIHRSAQNADAGNLTLTLSINNTVKWQDELSLDATSGNGINYELKNVSLKKGDRIYYEVDCHQNKTYADVYWHPEVEYTTLYADNATTFRMYDAIQVAGYRCQGYDGWYYMRETAAGYENLPSYELVNGATYRWYATDRNGNQTNTVTNWTTKPEWNLPTVLAWRAPYTGTVTLTTQNNEGTAPEPLKRSTPSNHPNAGTVTATILHNGDQVQKNDGTAAQWAFAKDNGSGVNYEITGVKVNAGDMIYHKVDCGTNNTDQAMHWQPYIKYTEMETAIYYNDSNYIKANDFNSAKGTQGYNGWYYMYKDSSGYHELPWVESESESKFNRGDGTVYEKIIKPGWNSPTAIVWKAPYTGVINLGLTEPMYRANADANNTSCGDITATILHNGAQLKQNDNSDAKWVFDNATKGEASNTTYDIKDISVQKGDLIYFEVDSGTKNAHIETCWSPTVKYTAYTNAEENYVKAFSATDAWVLIAQYNDDNTLVSINPYNATADKAIRCKVSPATGATNYKVFVWDNSEDKMLPLLTPNGEAF